MSIYSAFLFLGFLLFPVLLLVLWMIFMIRRSFRQSASMRDDIRVIADSVSSVNEDSSVD